MAVLPVEETDISTKWMTKASVKFSAMLKAHKVR